MQVLYYAITIYAHRKIVDIKNDSRMTSSTSGRIYSHDKGSLWMSEIMAARNNNDLRYLNSVMVF